MKSHRLRGLASEYAFASQYYELIDDESYSLIEPKLDTGWDFMVMPEQANKRMMKDDITWLHKK